MQIDIAAHIEKLLFLHDTLTIPSFGGFTAMRTPAGVDYAGSTVTPPSKTLAFNENLSVDDGLLTDDIAQEHGISAEEARAAIQQFVEQIQAQLNQREIVTLPGVGRLYKNYVQKIQFLPDATNFHAGSYGLPPLQFSPIARSREVAEKPAASNPEPNGSSQSTAVPATTAAPAKASNQAPPPLPPPPAFINDPYTPPRSSSARLGTGIAIGLLLCAVAFSAWWWQHKRGLPEDAQLTELLEESDENPVVQDPVSGGIAEIAKLAEKDNKTDDKKPASPTDKEDQDLGDEVSDAARDKAEVIHRQNEAPRTTSAPLPAEGAKECILLIATLQDRNNADRLIAKLKGGGYEVYYRQVRGHQIGIQFNYTDAWEVEQKKADLIRFTGEKGIVVKKK